jgi:hypothetical protein
MPHAKIEDRRECRADWYRSRYHNEVGFAAGEAERKAAWYALRAEDPAWLASQAEKKRLARRKKIKRK